jgi:glucose/mannose-6-phosphate isomerase
MLALVESLPEQLAASGSLDGLERIPPLTSRPDRVLLCGMGGSAIAGDLIQPLLAGKPFSLEVHRDYGLPGWVDDRTVVVASSYSGNTEETLAAVAAATERGCPMLAVTSGGELLRLSAESGTGPGSFAAVVLPGGLPPRASLGFGLGAQLWGLHRLGLLESPGPEIEAACRVLAAANPEYLDGAGDRISPTVALANACAGKFLAIYTTSGEAHGAGMRLKAQLNENSKCPASCVPFPELNHNDIVGWRLTNGQRHGFVLLVIRGGDENPRVSDRVAITLELIGEEFDSIHQILPRGGTVLARTLSLVQFGDYLSCHLAEVAGVDPVPVERIETLKTRLQKGRAG